MQVSKIFRLSAFGTLCALLILCSNAYASVAITSQNFPDSIFRKYVSENFDADSDGTLSDEEISAVKAVDVHSMGIARLNGIEYFTALEELNCRNNNITRLDVSNMTSLKRLVCTRNLLMKSLNASNCTSLTWLDCTTDDYDVGTKLEIININGCTSLTGEYDNENGHRFIADLGATNYSVTAFYARGCTALKELDVTALIKLKILDVSGCTALEGLSLNFNSGFTLTGVNDCTALESLRFGDYSTRVGYLQELDLSASTTLKRLEINENCLAALDLSHNTSLTYFICSPQKLPEKPIAFGSGTYPYKFAFSSIMPEDMISGVIPDSVHGYTSSGSLIDSNFSDGTAEFALLPAEIDYDYSTGSGDIFMSVNVPITASGSSSSSTVPAIMSSTLPNGVAGISYLAELYASGTHPITWTLTSGTLPDGLELSSSGTLQGTPTQTGEYTFTLQAQNSAGSASASYSVRITESQILSAPSITTYMLIEGTAEVSYGASVKASGARPMIWALVGGDLPDGLSFSDEGKISGTPSTAGTYTFTVQAQNAAGIDSRELTLKIAEALPKTKPVILTEELDPATIGANYVMQFTASGTPTVKWSLAKGSKLPKGLTLSESGLLSGLMPKNGGKKITVTAANDYGASSRIFKFSKYELPEIVLSSLKDAKVGKNYNVSIKKEGTKPLTWTLEGSLPDGLTFDSAKGKISGKATTPGTYAFRVSLSNPAGDFMRMFTLNVTADLPKITTSSLKAGTDGKPYKADVKVSGTKPITLMLSGYLPEGLTFNSGTGTITGTPTEICTDRKITITAQNVAGETVKELRMTVKGVAPKITASLPDGTVNTYYSAELSATGSKPITWTAEGLPSGLVLTDGKIIGAPTTAGTFKVKLTAANSVKSASKTFKLKIAAASAITSNMSSHKIIDEPEDYIIVAELGTISVDEAGMYSFDVTLSDDVPAGAELVWLANSSEPCDDDMIAEFSGVDGKEIYAVNDERRFSVSAWLNPGRVYSPAIAVR